LLKSSQSKTYTEAYKKAYDVSPDSQISTIHENASRTASLQQVNEALQNLFELDKTKQVVNNLHKLAISAEDQRVQHEATKTWLDRAIPKTDAPTAVQFNNIQINQREKYDL